MLRAGGLTSHEIADAWASWLGLLSFSLLLTVTSAKVTHPEAMVKRVRYITKMMNVHYFGRRWYRHPSRAIQCVIAIERHKSGNPHAHALLRFPDGLPLNFPRAWWQKVAAETGGFCKLEVPRSQADVVDYCCKYVVKGGEIVLSDNFRPERTQEVLFDERKNRAEASRLRVAAERDEQLRISEMLSAHDPAR